MLLFRFSDALAYFAEGSLSVATQTAHDTQMWDRFAGPLAIALAAAWAVLVFLWGPLLSRVRPDALAWSGLVFAFGVFWGILAFKMKWPELAGYPSSMAVGLAGALLQPAINDAIIAERANIARCEALQRDMLSARPRRADAPDLFQALGCRPQGTGNVYAPPIAKPR